MKFLFLSGHAHLALDPDSTHASGGAELQVALLSEELVARKHDVTILAADTGQQDGVVWKGVKIRTGNRYDTGTAADSLRALPRIFAVLRQEKPDYVVVYGWTAWLFILCTLRALVPFKLVFVCALDTEIDGTFRKDNPLRGFLFDQGMHWSDARLAITEHQARLFREQGMPCSVTRLLLQDHKPQDVGKTVDLLWVARCNPVKQPQLFLDLAERLPQARCRMICSIQDKPLWDAVSARASILPNVEFLERVPYRDIQSHFSTSRIFVNTSLHEGVPNTFIHSGLGHCAIASLICDPDGMFESFAAGVHGKGDFEAFVTSVGSLLADPAALRHTQEESLRFVQEWHGNPANVDAFLRGLHPPE